MNLDIISGATTGVNKLADAGIDTIKDAIGLGTGKSKPKGPKSNFNIEMFKAEVFNVGLAEEDKFEVEFGFPPILLDSKYKQQDLTRAGLMVESLYMPPLSIYTKQLKVYGPAYQRPVGVDFGGDGLSITFLVDQEMKIKYLFDYWMHRIFGNADYVMAYERQYAVNIMIRQLDRAGNVMYRMGVWDAWPKSIAPLQLANTAAGQFHKMTVTFAYRKWSNDETAWMQTKTAPGRYDPQSHVKVIGDGSQTEGPTKENPFKIPTKLSEVNTKSITSKLNSYVEPIATGVSSAVSEVTGTIDTAKKAASGLLDSATKTAQDALKGIPLKF